MSGIARRVLLVSLVRVERELKCICDIQIRWGKWTFYLISFQASVSSNRQLSFQCSYASLRAEMFQAHSLLLASCATMKSCPPPAIATAVAMATGQDVQRLSHFASQVSLLEK